MVSVIYITNVALDSERIMKSKTVSSFIASVAGALCVAPAMAADHSVSIVTTTAAPYSGVNLYQTTEKGVKLVKGSPYISSEIDYRGQLSIPLTLTMSPKHDFAYVVFTGAPFPKVEAFKVTARGLEMQWEKVMQTGDPSLQGSFIVAVDKYLIEYVRPGGSYWVTVFTEDGQQIVYDVGTAGNLKSAHIAPGGHFYYSCRNEAETFPNPSLPADTVFVFDLTNGPVTPDSTPLVESSDPDFVRSICN